MSISREIIVGATGNDPELTKYLQQMSEDPLMPVAVRRVIHEALKKQQTKIGELTEEIRKSLKLPKNRNGDAGFENDLLVITDPKTGMKNEFILFGKNKFIRDNWPSGRNPAIHIEKSGMLSPEELIIHELAHIRFMAFLDQSLSKLISKEKLPSWAVFHIKGVVYGLQESFLIYLSERFAYEMQYKYLKATTDSNSKWSHTPHPTFGEYSQWNETTVRKRIIEHLKKNYPETNDSRFRQFDDLPIATILTGITRQ